MTMAPNPRSSCSTKASAYRIAFLRVMTCRNASAMTRRSMPASRPPSVARALLRHLNDPRRIIPGAKRLSLPSVPILNAFASKGDISTLEKKGTFVFWVDTDSPPAANLTSTVAGDTNTSPSLCRFRKTRNPSTAGLRPPPYDGVLGVVVMLL